MAQRRAGRARVTVLTFQPRFAPLVAAGTKTQTIRPPRKRPISIGDPLSLRRWSGRPYMTPQVLLRESRCVDVCAVVVGYCADGYPGGIAVRGERLSATDKAAFARADGFANVPEMMDWFDNAHGLPFVGVLIRWAP
jgi:hypothetical protein